MTRVPTSCLETVGPAPKLKFMPDTRPEGTPPGLACFDTPGQLALGRYFRETLRYQQAVEDACGEKETNDE